VLFRSIGQSEAPVEEREVLPDIARRHRPRFWVELWQHHSLAPAVDPSGDQRLDAVRDPELLWGVTQVEVGSRLRTGQLRAIKGALSARGSGGGRRRMAGLAAGKDRARSGDHRQHLA
jgi:hypothetical protein